MKFRKLLATLLVPALLAVGGLGVAPAPATALPRCEYLEGQYERYAALAFGWFGRYRETRIPQDLQRAEEYEELRVMYAQQIMDGC